MLNSRPTICFTISSSEMSFTSQEPTYVPSRMIVMSSAICRISAILWLIYIIETPRDFNSLIIRNSASTSLSVSDEVGSSKITSLAFWLTAFAISTDCICPIDSVPSFALGLKLIFTSFNHFSASWFMVLWSTIFNGPIFIKGYLPRYIFSAMERAGTGCSS